MGTSWTSKALNFLKHPVTLVCVGLAAIGGGYWFSVNPFKQNDRETTTQSNLPRIALAGSVMGFAFWKYFQADKESNIQSIWKPRTWISGNKPTGKDKSNTGSNPIFIIVMIVCLVLVVIGVMISQRSDNTDPLKFAEEVYHLEAGLNRQ